MKSAEFDQNTAPLKMALPANVYFYRVRRFSIAACNIIYWCIIIFEWDADGDGQMIMVHGNIFILISIIYVMVFPFRSYAEDFMPGRGDVERIISVDSRGGLLSNAAAIRVAEIIISDNYGEDILNSQLPLYAEDDGEFWIVYSKNSSKSNIDGFAIDNPIYLKIRKLNCEVVSFLFGKFK